MLYVVYVNRNSCISFYYAVDYRLREQTDVVTEVYCNHILEKFENDFTLFVLRKRTEYEVK